jgi:hypothetical protein
MLDRFAFQRQRSQVAGKVAETIQQPRHGPREPRVQKPPTPRETC